MSTSTGPGRPDMAILKRLPQRRRNVRCLGDQEVVLGDRQRDAGDVGFLERVGSDQRFGDLAGDADDRNRVHHRVGDAGDQVGRAGPGGGQRDADLAARPRVAVGHMRGALFVADQHVANRVIEQCVVGRQDCPARIPEHRVHALFDEDRPEDVRAT